MMVKCLICGHEAGHSSKTVRDLLEVTCPRCGCVERLVAVPMRMATREDSAKLPEGEGQAKEDSDGSEPCEAAGGLAVEMCRPMPLDIRYQREQDALQAVGADETRVKVLQEAPAV